MIARLLSGLWPRDVAEVVNVDKDIRDVFHGSIGSWCLRRDDASRDLWRPSQPSRVTGFLRGTVVSPRK